MGEDLSIFMLLYARYAEEWSIRSHDSETSLSLSSTRKRAYIFDFVDVHGGRGIIGSGGSGGGGGGGGGGWWLLWQLLGMLHLICITSPTAVDATWFEG